MQVLETPPPGAVVLLNGKDLSNWMKRNGEPAAGKVEDGVIIVTPGAATS